jgi:hypothetical protein
MLPRVHDHSGSFGRDRTYANQIRKSRDVPSPALRPNSRAELFKPPVLLSHHTDDDRARRPIVTWARLLVRSGLLCGSRQCILAAKGKVGGSADRAPVPKPPPFVAPDGLTIRVTPPHHGPNPQHQLAPRETRQPRRPRHNRRSHPFTGYARPMTRLTTMAATPASTAFASGEVRMPVIALDPAACCGV